MMMRKKSFFLLHVCVHVFLPTDVMKIGQTVSEICHHLNLLKELMQRVTGYCYLLPKHLPEKNKQKKKKNIENLDPIIEKLQ